MQIRSAQFSASAPDLRFCPPEGVPEFAVIGRSNVGKSSVINLLTERKDLAKVSGTPGKTKLINFFAINGQWSLVDLPGYGYAKVSQEKRADFNEAVADFLEQRTTLRGVFVLIDSRLQPQTLDLDFVQWLQTCPPPFALVMTKIDKLSAPQLRESITRFQQALAERHVAERPILTCSAKEKTGRSDLLRYIDAALARKTPA